MGTGLPIGCIVYVSGSGLGLGKLISIKGSEAQVEWFTSVSNHLEGKDEVVKYDIGRLKRCAPYSQTRCYVMMHDGAWRIGRFSDYLVPSSLSEEINYGIRFPGRHDTVDVPETDVFVRCYKSSNDPIDKLIYSNQETPFFYSHKMKFLRSVVKQRSVCQGLTGLLSSRIRLFPHQIRVVNKVLKDPMQRYLLADEVGLGKTIEAGIVLRQVILDNIRSVQDGTFRALIIVPQSLKAQWFEELDDKFYIEPDNCMVQVYDFEEFKDFSISDRYDICIIDEAHHIASLYQDRKLWQKYTDLANASEKLLLLSATPVIRHEQEYLAMLSLLEPAHYNFDNLNAFKRGVEDRQKIGTFLLGFNPGMQSVMVKQKIKTLRLLFKNNAPIMELTDRLEYYCDSAQPSQATIDSLINRIRVTICETCRIYRRTIRTPRQSVGSFTLVQRIKDSQNLVEECDYDGRISTITNFLEEWRSLANIDLAVNESSTRNTRVTGLTNVFITFLECFDNSIDLLKIAVEHRLASGKGPKVPPTILEPDQEKTLSSEPHFAEEQKLLSAMLRALNTSVDENKYDFLVKRLKEAFAKENIKCVIFTSSTFVGEEIIERLKATRLNAEVFGRLCSGGQEKLPEGLDIFYKPVPFEKPIVLVCDRSGEEGLNLQKADLLIHFDLPWNPNRIEQRVGRFDRIGRSSEVRSIVFVPCAIEDDLSLGWLPGTWYSILREGFNIFNESISDLQFYTNDAMPRLKETAFRGGNEELKAMMQSIKEGIEEERKIIKEQNFLDSLEAYEEEGTDFIGPFTEYDNNTESILKPFESWTVEALQFNKEIKRYYKYGKNQFPIQPDNKICPARYKYVNDEHRITSNGTIQHLSGHGRGQRTLMPIDIWAKIKERMSKFNVAPIETFGTFSRKQACEVPEMPLFRLGHPFYEFMYDNALWDDRGQTYAMWRCIPELPFKDNRLFFVLDYVIEINIDSVSSTIANLTKNAYSKEALKRQIDSWFPPQCRNVCIDQDLQIVQDAGLIELLARPYTKISAGGTDLNLDEDNSKVIFQVVDEDRWSIMCKGVRNKSEQSIRCDLDLINYCNEKYDLATKELQMRLERLRFGLKYLKDSDITGKDQAGIDAFISEEESLYSALISRIKTPDITLVAGGAIILSVSQPPCTESKAEST